jgi:hypothetical protein
MQQKFPANLKPAARTSLNSPSLCRDPFFFPGLPRRSPESGRRCPSLLKFQSRFPHEQIDLEKKIKKMKFVVAEIQGVKNKGGFIRVLQLVPFVFEDLRLFLEGWLCIYVTTLDLMQITDLFSFL